MKRRHCIPALAALVLGCNSRAPSSSAGSGSSEGVTHLAGAPD